MGVRLFHDDVRPAPEGWLRAVTNGDAKEILRREDVVECSLDHDLGFHEGAETGLELVEWMVQNDMVPEKVTIHSWNPDGAKYMAARLNRFGHSVTIRPFKPSGATLPSPRYESRPKYIGGKHDHHAP